MAKTIFGPSGGRFMIAVVCPSCQRKLHVAGQFAGRKVRCPGCGDTMVVADTTAPTPTVAYSQLLDMPTASYQAATAFPFLEPAQSVDEIGRLGPYRVLELLGLGGMGAV